MRDFFSRSLLFPANRRAFAERRDPEFYRRWAKVGGQESARKRREGIRLRLGGRVWSPRQICGS